MDFGLYEGSPYEKLYVDLALFAAEKINVRDRDHVGADGTHARCKDDQQSQWNKAKFGTPPTLNPLTDRHHYLLHVISSWITITTKSLDV